MQISFNNMIFFIRRDVFWSMTKLFRTVNIYAIKNKKAKVTKYKIK
jgi:hypothetical protein